MNNPNLISVIEENPEQFSRAKSLAKRLNISFNPENKQDYPFWLSYQVNQLIIHSTQEKNVKPISIDYSHIDFRSYELRESLLTRAIGVKKTYKPFVLDATAGFGMDAVMLASLGCKIQMLERSQIMFELLTNALEPLKTISFFSNISWIQADAIHYLDSINEQPDVIYLDPMYPERGKNALPKKEMRILRELIGEDLDAPLLLEKALKIAKQRVVVKRRRLSATLTDLKPGYALTGKSVRFDVYLI